MDMEKSWGNIKNQIDYITIHERFRNSLLHSKAFPGADCGSDHVPVICNVQVRLRKLKKGKLTTKAGVQLATT